MYTFLSHYQKGNQQNSQRNFLFFKMQLWKLPQIHAPHHQKLLHKSISLQDARLVETESKCPARKGRVKIVQRCDDFVTETRNINPQESI